jgi:hypothetical protein
VVARLIEMRSLATPKQTKYGKMKALHVLHVDVALVAKKMQHQFVLSVMSVVHQQQRWRMLSQQFREALSQSLVSEHQSD